MSETPEEASFDHQFVVKMQGGPDKYAFKITVSLPVAMTLLRQAVSFYLSGRSRTESYRDLRVWMDGMKTVEVARLGSSMDFMRGVVEAMMVATTDEIKRRGVVDLVADPVKEPDVEVMALILGGWSDLDPPSVLKLDP